jgi:2-phospho-L-lactate guanylyltransferase
MRSASTPAHETAVEQDAESDTHWSQSPTSAVSITPEVVMMILGGSSDSDGEMSIQHRNNHKDTTQDGIQPNQITVTTDDRALTPAVNGCLNRLSDPKAQFGELAVVMADLALITPTAIERLFAREGDVVLAPGRGGGTNAIVIRHPSFTVNYHGASYQDHHQIAVDASLSVGVIDSMRLGTDIDEPTDLPEVLFHNSGMASEWLQSVGIKLSLDDDTGRVGITHQRNRADED